MLTLYLAILYSNEAKLFPSHHKTGRQTKLGGQSDLTWLLLLFPHYKASTLPVDYKAKAKK